MVYCYQKRNTTTFKAAATGELKRKDEVIMKFTFNEWGKIKHGLEVAHKEYERMMQNCKISDNENSMYQIFKRQMEEAALLIKKIENTEV